MKLKEELLKYIEDDKIYTFNLDDCTIKKTNTDNLELDNLENEILITATTMDEQNKKSYYSSKSILDCALFPQEKFLMGFELVNFF